MPSEDILRAHPGEVQEHRTLDLGLTLVVRDVGVTMGVEVWAGPRLLTAFKPGTRHSDRAVEIATAVVAEALGSILRPALETAAAAHDCRTYDPTDDPAL